MTYEVEQKYRVEDLPRVQRELESLGVTFSSAVEQVDRYFNHPSRDFVKTDEAFRIRSMGKVNRITYKGPRIDTTTKTRQELELPLPDGEDAAMGFAELLRHLGFAPVSEVQKWRRSGKIDHDGDQVEVVLDEVSDLGTFVELEQVVGEEGLDRARQNLAEIADRLRLTDIERRSYLELLLAARELLHEPESPETT